MLYALFLADTPIYLPYITRKGFKLKHYRLFGMFPVRVERSPAFEASSCRPFFVVVCLQYLLSIVISWLLAVLLTVTNLEKPNGYARVDNNLSVAVLTDSPYFHMPFPGVQHTIFASDAFCLLNSANGSFLQANLDRQDFRKIIDSLIFFVRYKKTIQFGPFSRLSRLMCRVLSRKSRRIRNAGASKRRKAAARLNAKSRDHRRRLRLFSRRHNGLRNGRYGERFVLP